MQQLSTTRQTAYEVVTSTIRARGPFGLYKGLDSMVYFATPKAAIRFSGFEAASNSMRNADGSPMFGGMTSFCAGLVALLGLAIVGEALSTGLLGIEDI